MKLDAFPNLLPLREACPKTDNASLLVLAKGNAASPKYLTRDTIKGKYLPGKMVQNPILYVSTKSAPSKLVTDFYSVYSFLMLFLWTVTCYSNFQMAGVFVNSSTHVPILPWSIPRTSNRKVCCDCTALIWNIHLTCEVLCCHLPCVNSMASIIEGLGRGRFEAPMLCPVWWPKATWSVWAVIRSWKK